MYYLIGFFKDAGHQIGCEYWCGKADWSSSWERWKLLFIKIIFILMKSSHLDSCCLNTDQNIYSCKYVCKKKQVTNFMDTKTFLKFRALPCSEWAGLYSY